MARVLDDILKSFYKKLSETNAIDGDTLAEVQKLFESKKKLKADDFVAVISQAGPEKSS